VIFSDALELVIPIIKFFANRHLFYTVKLSLHAVMMAWAL
jgi:hypothetical protein